MENEKGELWVALPSKEYTDKEGAKKYEYIVRIKDRALLDKITDLAKQEFTQENQLHEDDVPF